MLARVGILGLVGYEYWLFNSLRCLLSVVPCLCFFNVSLSLAVGMLALSGRKIVQNLSKNIKQLDKMASNLIEMGSEGPLEGHVEPKSCPDRFFIYFLFHFGPFLGGQIHQHFDVFLVCFLGLQFK